MNKNKRVIVEQAVESQPTIVKNISSNGLDIVVFKAVLQEAERPNRNKRIYTKKALQEALDREMVQEKLQRKAFVSEAGHPLENSIQRQTYIDQSNICCIITKLEWEGNLLIGTIETANTQRGRDMAGLIRQGCQVAFSMRGVGGEAKKKNGCEFIDGGLYIISYDWVIFPSHQQAYLREIISESADDYIANLNIKESNKSLVEGYTLNFDDNEAEEIINENGSKELEEIFTDIKYSTKNILREDRTFFRDNNKDFYKYRENEQRNTIDRLFSRIR